jgi:monoamine oxidase
MPMPQTTPTTPDAASGGSVGRSTDGSMSRRDVLRMASLLGLLMLPVGCLSDGERDANNEADRSLPDDALGEAAGRDRSVIVVGAGAAGLSAAHLLTRAGVDVRILEAGATHGGRMRHTTDFVDFPIPLGAEWIHDDAAVLNDIAGEPVEVALVGYGRDDTLGYYDGVLRLEPVADDEDLKFVGSSWLDFFETHVLPGIADKLRLDTQVVGIDATGEHVTVTDERGSIIEADAAIVTVPVSILRARDITFTPDLDQAMWTAIDDVEVWGGIKVFIEFDERFYPTFLTFPDRDSTAGQRLYFDAAHGQDSVAHVLGLFAVGAPAAAYQGLDDDALRAYVLAELDEVFDGAASRSYRRHLTQDWTAEPHIRQAYVADHADWRLVRTLGQPTNESILFAGDAHTDGENWSEVHVAARSARVAVERLLRAW